MFFLAGSTTALYAAPSADNSRKNFIDRGRYLVNIAGCHECHTPNYLKTGNKTPEKDFLTGSAQGVRGPLGTTYATNLRLYFQELTADQWIEIAKEVQRRPPMTSFALNAMTEEDAYAVYLYIRQLGAAGSAAPKLIPAKTKQSKTYQEVSHN